MPLLSKFFEVYIKSSLHVALAVTAFAYVTIHELGLSSDPVLFGFIFSSTVVSYNLTKYAAVISSDTIRSGPILKWVGIITAFSFLVMFALLIYLPLDVILIAALLGIITIAYALPVSDNRRNLRNVYGIKIAVIALVWAGVTVGLPVVYHGTESISAATVILQFLQRILFVAVLILPFDIRDYRSDDQTLGTLPQIIGVKESKLLGFILLITCLFLEWMMTPVLTVQFFTFVVVAVLTAAMVRRSMIRQSRYFASFWVEGIPIIWALMLYI